jgi:TonB family protein
VRYRRFAPHLLTLVIVGVLGHVGPAYSQAIRTPVYEATTLPGRPDPKRDYFPAPAIRQGKTGRVCLAYSVDKRGHPTNIEILDSGGPLLDGAARQFLAAFRFDVPSDWAVTAGPEKRYRFGVVFNLTGKPQVPLYDESIPTVVITAPF